MESHVENRVENVFVSAAWAGNPAPKIKRNKKKTEEEK